MAVLVTGGNGFIGSNIVKVLLDAGQDVVVFDVRPPDAMNIRFLGVRAFEVEQVIGDIRDLNLLLDLGSRHPIDRIVHCAVFSVPRQDIEQAHSLDIVDVNVMGTANVMEFAKASLPKRVVYMSSRTVYGVLEQDPNRPEEGWLGRPQRLYPITKYAGEMIALRYGETFGFDVRVARVTGPYGPMERRSEFRPNMSALHDWTAAALAVRQDQRAGPQPGHGHDSRVGCRFRRHAKILLAESPNYPIYNVGAEEEHSVDEILRTLEELVPGSFVRNRQKRGLDRPTQLRGWRPHSSHPALCRSGLHARLSAENRAESVLWTGAVDYEYFD